MDINYSYNFTAEVWPYPGPGSWHFITVPLDISEEIKSLQVKRPGFGAVKVQVLIGGTAWQTSLFPDKESGCYFLPVKAAVRKREQLAPGVEALVELSLI